MAKEDRKGSLFLITDNGKERIIGLEHILVKVATELQRHENGVWVKSLDDVSDDRIHLLSPNAENDLFEMLCLDFEISLEFNDLKEKYQVLYKMLNDDFSALAQCITACDDVKVESK